MHFVHPPCFAQSPPPPPLFASLLFARPSKAPTRKDTGSTPDAVLLAPRATERFLRPVKNQPAVHRVQRFNKFQGSSQGMATLWTATQNQEPFKYFWRLIIDSLTPSGGHFFRSACWITDCTCACARACVRVGGGLSRWTRGIDGRNKVTTETRVSKAGRPISETWHFQVALIRGYRINLTLLSPGPHGRKWVQGRDLESHESNVAGRVAQGAAGSESLEAPDGSSESESMAGRNIPRLRFGVRGNCHITTTQRQSCVALTEISSIDTASDQFPHGSGFRGHLYVAAHAADNASRLQWRVATESPMGTAVTNDLLRTSPGPRQTSDTRKEEAILALSCVWWKSCILEIWNLWCHKGHTHLLANTQECQTRLRSWIQEPTFLVFSS